MIKIEFSREELYYAAKCRNIKNIDDDTLIELAKEFCKERGYEVVETINYVKPIRKARVVCKCKDTYWTLAEDDKVDPFEASKALAWAANNPPKEDELICGLDFGKEGSDKTVIAPIEMTTSLKVKDLEEIIKQHFKNTGLEVTDIEFKCEEKTVGIFDYAIGPVLDSCECKVKPLEVKE